jgi:formylmethanofuran dehydrogenase subunit B
MIAGESRAMSMGSPGDQHTSPTIVADVVCTSCSCLCDDIVLEIEGDRILEARNACPIGRARFLEYRPTEGPPCLIDGQPATMEEGTERAARILTEARHPLIIGLSETTTEAQRAAVSLGDWIGACVEVSNGEGGCATTDALQSVGEVTCTLGEIKNRADLIVVWRADPLVSHPRLFSRYALDPSGTFVPAGRGDRYCVIIDDRETESVREAADEFLWINEGGEVEALWALRALAKGIPLDAEPVELETGVPLQTWQRLLERMRAARYGVLFYGLGATNKRAAHLIARGIHSLTRDLNATTRFVGLPLSVGGNVVGARNVLAWRTGYAGAVSLAHGYPRYSPGEFNAHEIIRQREADVALIVSGDPISPLSAPAREYASRIPRIVLTRDGEQSSPGAAVVFRTAVFGINTTGTAYRMDGVPLPLRTALASPFPSDADVLRSIESRVRSLDASGHGGEGRA